ncbi:MAG: hypothetical protein OEZ18_02015 [Candidatus Bathyarchaeota archaeon]|nr:hypothetical protein [Candidatus Bathyarchaeota archaeon]
MNRNVALTSLAWGLFFILIGLSLVAMVYGVDVIPYVALGAGIILIGLNITRKGLGMMLSKFSLFIGIVAFALGGAVLLGFTAVPWYAMIIVLIGLFIIAEAARSLTKSR